MLKNKSKLVVFFMVIILLLSTVSFATNDIVATNETTANETTSAEQTNQTPDVQAAVPTDIHNGDLYIFENNVVMDKLVDGNVFIIGQNVEITGKVNGSLYVLANKVTVSEETYIVQSLYVCSNELILKGAVNDLYACCNKVDMPFNSFVIRDLRVTASTFNYSGGVGRNAYVYANNFDFISNAENPAIIYGNLEYTSSKELTLSNDLVNGDITYKKFEEQNTEKNVGQIITDKLLSLCKTLIYTAVVFALILWLAPNFTKKASSYIEIKKSAISFGIGFAGFIIAVLGSILLLIAKVFTPVAVSLLGISLLMVPLSFAITAICISYKIKEKFSLENKIYALVLLATTIVLWLLKLIPYVGSVISIIIALFGFGVVLCYLFTKNKTSEKKVEKTKKVAKKETKSDKKKEDKKNKDKKEEDKKDKE